MSLSLNVEERNFWSRLDLNFIFLILALNVIGLVNLYSATHGPEAKLLEPLFRNQLIWLAGGWTLFLTITVWGYRWILKFAIIVYVLNILALIYVKYFGESALGAQRWIDFGIFRYQPSETMKLGLILIFTVYFSKAQIPQSGMGARSLLVPFLILAIPFWFVFKQPDLGTAMMLCAIGFSYLLFMKINWKIIILLVFGFLSAVPYAWTHMKEYQKNRIRTFISPDIDPLGTGYNKKQSIIAVGSGQFLGKGFRKGTQSQLEFLPERHTDFIFSVLSEEHGFWGSISTIAIFICLFIFMIRIAATAKDKMGALIVVGVGAYLFWHMFINIGMVIGILPIVGVPLPLVSYGGSSMLTTMVGLGLVSSVAYRRFLF